MIQVRIRFHPEAELEFGNGIQWYEYQSKGLGLEFLLCIDEAIEKIKRTPQLFPWYTKIYAGLSLEDFHSPFFMK